MNIVPESFVVFWPLSVTPYRRHARLTRGRVAPFKQFGQVTHPLKQPPPLPLLPFLYRHHVRLCYQRHRRQRGAREKR